MAAERIAGAARVLVLGAGDIGSAVAHRLFAAGADVLLSDVPRPTHARRGMAYTDAFFDGESTLEGVRARYLPLVSSVAAAWAGHEVLPIVSVPDESLFRAFAFDAIVEATMRRREPPDLRGAAPLTIGLGPGHVPGVNCHIAIETRWGEDMGDVIRDHAPAPRSGGPVALAGVTRARFVEAPASGRWSTRARLGEPIRAQDVVGHVADEAVRAPIDGHLRGLSRDGVDVRSGQKVIEVDPRDPPQIFGLGERPRAIAAGVAEALGLAPGR